MEKLYMKDRIDDKILEIEEYLSDLENFKPDSFELYKDNKEKKAVCEHYFEKIIGAVEDLAFAIIKEKGLKIGDEERVFSILSEENIISDDLAKKLREAKGMRNIIAHEYGEIDDEIVFNSIKNELIKDVEEFIDLVELLMEENMDEKTKKEIEEDRRGKSIYHEEVKKRYKLFSKG